MAKTRIKVNDTVYVLSGKDAGKTGKVIKIIPKSGRIIVEGVNMITKHERPNPRLGTGGIVHQEGSIDISNVMLVCPNCSRPSKVGARFADNGDKVRYCKACDKDIDALVSKAE